MQAKHRTFNSWVADLVAVAEGLAKLSAEAGAWLASEGPDSVLAVSHALKEAGLTVALPVTVTPELAKILSGLQSERQRRPSRKHVEALARDMENGHWPLTGDTVKVDWAGTLRDGGHRMAAVEQAGATITTYFAFGVNPDSVHDVDAGKPRSPGEVLHMSGKENGTALAALVLRLIAWDQGYYVTPGRPRWSREELLDYERDHPELAAIVSTMKHKAPDGFPPSIFHTAYVLFRRVSPDSAESFMTALSTGANLPPGSPILYLRDRVPRGWSGGASAKGPAGAPAFTHDIILAKLIAGWNRWRDGQPVTRNGLATPAKLTNKNFPMPY